MALKAMVTKLEDLPEAQRSMYRKEGDGDAAVFLLDVEPVQGWELTGEGLKAALKRERDAREAAEQKVTAFKDIDPGKAKDALTKVEAMKSWTPEDKVREQIELRTREVATQKDTEIGTLKQENADLFKSYRAITLDREIESAATAAKFLSPALAPRLFRDTVDLIKKDGKYIPVVLGPDGKPLEKTENNGVIRHVTIKEFVETQAKSDDFKPLIQGNTATGTRGPVNNPGTPQPSQIPNPGIDQANALDRLATSMGR